MSISYSQVKILSGQSLSGVCDLQDQELVGIFMPAAWTAAGLSFAAAPDTLDMPGLIPQAFNPVTDKAGAELAYVVAANKHVLVNLAHELSGLGRFVKFRSGTSAVPVAQGADATLVLVLRKA